MVATLVLLGLIVIAGTDSIILGVRRSRRLRAEGIRTLSWFETTGSVVICIIGLFIMLLSVNLPAKGEAAPEPVLQLEPMKATLSLPGTQK